MAVSTHHRPGYSQRIAAAVLVIGCRPFFWLTGRRTVVQRKRTSRLRSTSPRPTTRRRGRFPGNEAARAVAEDLVRRCEVAISKASVQAIESGSDGRSIEEIIGIVENDPASELPRAEGPPTARPDPRDHRGPSLGRDVRRRRRGRIVTEFLEPSLYGSRRRRRCRRPRRGSSGDLCGRRSPSWASWMAPAALSTSGYCRCCWQPCAPMRTNPRCEVR